MSNKVVKWIGHHHYKICFKICRRYFKKAGTSGSNFFLDVSFYPWYALRTFFAFASFIFHRKDLKAKVLGYSVDSSWGQVLVRFDKWPYRFLGLTYFVKPAIQPQFYESMVNINELSFEVPNHPVKVSIIITSNGSTATIDCLRSLKLNIPTDVVIDVAVVGLRDDSETQNRLKNMEGLRYVDAQSDVAQNNLLGELITS